VGQENTIASRTTFEYLLQDGWVQVAACVGSRDYTVFEAFFAFCKFFGIFMKITTKSPKKVQKWSQKSPDFVPKA